MKNTSTEHRYKLLTILIKPFYYLITWVAAIIPFSMMQRLGQYVGQLGWYLPSQYKSTIKTNIKLTKPTLTKAEQNRLAHDNFQHTVQFFFEAMSVWGQPFTKLQHLIKHSHNEHLIAEGLAAGNGVLVLCPHLGMWELLGAYMAHHYPDGIGLYKPYDNSTHDQLVKLTRKHIGEKVIPANANGVKTAYRKLKDNKVVFILPDQEPGKFVTRQERRIEVKKCRQFLQKHHITPAKIIEDIRPQMYRLAKEEHINLYDEALLKPEPSRNTSGIFAPFFNINAWTMVLPSRLIAKHHPKVIFTYIKRNAIGNGFELYFREAPKDIYATELTTSVQGLNKGLEALIDESPEQYLWAYKRFRSRPYIFEENFYSKRYQELAEQNLICSQHNLS